MRQTRRFYGRARWLAAAWASLLAHGTLASDPNQKLQFHISSQPLESALLEFARQADLQVAMASACVVNIQARSVNGMYSALVALDRLLKGSGLTYSLVGDTVMVKTRVPCAGDDPDRAVTTGPKPSMHSPTSPKS